MRDGLGCAFADLSAIQIDPGHPRLCREGDEFCFVGGKLATAKLVLFYGEHNDGAAFGSFVGERRKLGRIGHLRLAHSRSWEKLGGLAVAERNRAGLVEKESVHVSSCFDSAS